MGRLILCLLAALVLTVPSGCQSRSSPGSMVSHLSAWFHPTPTKAAQQIVAKDTGTKPSHRQTLAQLADENLAEIDSAVVWMVVAASLLTVAGVAIAWFGGSKLGTGMVVGGGSLFVVAMTVKALAPYAMWIALGVMAVAGVCVLAHFLPRWWAHLRSRRVAAAAASAPPAVAARMRVSTG